MKIVEVRITATQQRVVDGRVKLRPKGGYQSRHVHWAHRTLDAVVLGRLVGQAQIDRALRILGDLSTRAA